MYIKIITLVACLALAIGSSRASTSTEDPMTTTVIYTTAEPGPQTLPAPPNGKVVVRQKIVKPPTIKPTPGPVFSEEAKVELLALYYDPVDSEEGKKIGSIFLIVMGVFIGILVLSDIPTLVVHTKNFALKNCAYKCTNKKPYTKTKVMPLNGEKKRVAAARATQQGAAGGGVTMRNRQETKQATVTKNRTNGQGPQNQNQPPMQMQQRQAVAAGSATVVELDEQNGQNAGPQAQQQGQGQQPKRSPPPAWSANDDSKAAPMNDDHNNVNSGKPEAPKSPRPGSARLAPPPNKQQVQQAQQAQQAQQEQQAIPNLMDDDPPPYPGSPLPTANPLPMRRPPRSQRAPFWDPDAPMGPDGMPLQNDGLAMPRPVSPSAYGPWGTQ